MIYVIDDDLIMAECVARACRGHEVQIFSNAIEAAKMMDENGMNEANETNVAKKTGEKYKNEKNVAKLPKLIFLDILLDGPDGFTLLNELASYTDTAAIPVVVVSSLDFKGLDLTEYGVVGVLDKAEMLPEEILEYARKYDT